MDSAPLLGATRRLHEAIRAEVRDRLDAARRSGDARGLTAPGAWGAGDLSYALDEAVEPLLAAFGEELGASHPTVLVAEGPGVARFGAGASGAPLRAIVDPIDGTRSLMHDMRSAWAVTGVAPDRGDATRLSDVAVAVQTELPPSTAAVYHVVTAVSGEGATVARHDVATGAELERAPLRPPPRDRLDNAYFSFTRYLPVERPLVAALERAFLERALAAHDLSPRLVYDDQYLCSAGQLFLVATGRYRMLADLRAWITRVHGLPNFTAKPYDVGALLAFREAGMVVLDGALEPLDAPLDTETPLDVVAFPDAEACDLLLPHLRAALHEVGPFE